MIYPTDSMNLSAERKHGAIPHANLRTQDPAPFKINFVTKVLLVLFLKPIVAYAVQAPFLFQKLFFGAPYKRHKIHLFIFGCKMEITLLMARYRKIFRNHHVCGLSPYKNTLTTICVSRARHHFLALYPLIGPLCLYCSHLFFREFRGQGASLPPQTIPKSCHFHHTETQTTKFCHYTEAPNTQSESQCVIFVDQLPKMSMFSPHPPPSVPPLKLHCCR